MTKSNTARLEANDENGYFALLMVIFLFNFYLMYFKSCLDCGSSSNMYLAIDSVLACLAGPKKPRVPY